jgi:CBS domain-containing protein
MMAGSVASIVVRVRPLAPEDSLARAAEAVRLSPGGVAPVQVAGSIAGLVSADALSEWIAAVGVDSARGATVAQVMRPAQLPLRGDASIPEALEWLRQEDLPAAPVIDGFGRYQGMVGRGELLAAAMGALRPPLIGGMATPFGVYLTDGTRRGGVGDMALVSTGIFLAVIQVLGSWLGYRASVAVMALLTRFAPEWSALWLGSLPPILPPPLLYATLSLLVFGLLFRYSLVTGYHAAEHQVVHTIEQGDDLRPDVVESKPRVHPRCGTNLMAAFAIFLILERWTGILAFVVALISWRFFGALLQQYVTTRPARPREIASGLTAGRELLERYQTGIGIHASGWRRVWNMGLLQVAFGFTLIWLLLYFGQGLIRPESLEAMWFNHYFLGS